MAFFPVFHGANCLIRCARNVAQLMGLGRCGGAPNLKGRPTLCNYQNVVSVGEAVLSCISRSQLYHTVSGDIHAVNGFRQIWGARQISKGPLCSALPSSSI